MRVRRSRATLADRAVERGALAAAVFAAREDLGLRQEELAELAGCSVGFLRQLEQGSRSQGLSKVLDVLEVLGLGLRVSVGGAGDVTLDPAVESRFESRIS